MPAPGAMNLSQLLPMLNSKVPPCEPGFQLRALQEAAVRFCDESRAWKQNLTPIDTVADAVHYSIVNPWEADIVAIDRVGLRTEDQIDDDADDEGTEIPQRLYDYDPDSDTLEFSSSPSGDDVTDAMLVRAILVPRLDCHEIAGWFLNLYRNGIVAAAAADICSKPKFFNPVITRQQTVVYNNALARATMDAKRGRTTKQFVSERGYDLL